MMYGNQLYFYIARIMDVSIQREFMIVFTVLRMYSLRSSRITVVILGNESAATERTGQYDSVR